MKKMLFDIEFFDGTRITAVGTSCQDVIEQLMERMHAVGFSSQVEWRVRSIQYIKDMD